MPDKGTLELARPVFHVRDSLNSERMIRQVRRGIRFIGAGALQEPLEEAGHAVRVEIGPHHNLETDSVSFLLRAAGEFQLIRYERGLAAHHDRGRRVTARIAASRRSQNREKE